MDSKYPHKAADVSTTKTTSYTGEGVDPAGGCVSDTTMFSVGGQACRNILKTVFSSTPFSISDEPHSSQGQFAGVPSYCHSTLEDIPPKHLSGTVSDRSVLFLISAEQNTAETTEWNRQKFNFSGVWEVCWEGSKAWRTSFAKPSEVYAGKRAKIPENKQIFLDLFLWLCQKLKIFHFSQRGTVGDGQAKEYTAMCWVIGWRLMSGYTHRFFANFKRLWLRSAAWWTKIQIGGMLRSGLDLFNIRTAELPFKMYHPTECCTVIKWRQWTLSQWGAKSPAVGWHSYMQGGSSDWWTIHAR